MTLKKEGFVLRHLEAVICLLIWVAALVYTLGLNNATVNTTVEQHERAIVELKSDQRKHEASIAEIKSDLRVIVEWVKEQKEKP